MGDDMQVCVDVLQEFSDMVRWEIRICDGKTAAGDDASPETDFGLRFHGQQIEEVTCNSYF
jgi:hypothetical protein